MERLKELGPKDQLGNSSDVIYFMISLRKLKRQTFSKNSFWCDEKRMDVRGQWSRKNTTERSQQDSVDAYYKPIAALSLSSYKSIAVSCLFEPRNVVL